MGHALRVFALTYMCLTYIDHCWFHRVASFLYVYSMGVPCCCMIGTVSVPYLCCIFAVALLVIAVPLFVIAECLPCTCLCRFIAVPLPCRCLAFAVSLPCLCRGSAVKLPRAPRVLAAPLPSLRHRVPIFSVAILVVVRVIALPRVVACFLLMCRVVSMPFP
jgi:hypothetical protein